MKVVVPIKAPKLLKHARILHTDRQNILEYCAQTALKGDRQRWTCNSSPVTCDVTLGSYVCVTNAATLGGCERVKLADPLQLRMHATGLGGSTHGERARLESLEYTRHSRADHGEYTVRARGVINTQYKAPHNIQSGLPHWQTRGL